MVACSFEDALANLIKIICNDWKPCSLCTPFQHLSSQGYRIIFNDFPRLNWFPDWHKLGSGRDNGYPWFPRHLDACMSTGCDSPKIHGSKNVACRKNQLCCDNILTHRTHMTPWCDSCADAYDLRMHWFIIGNRLLRNMFNVFYGYD